MAMAEKRDKPRSLRTAQSGGRVLAVLAGATAAMAAMFAKFASPEVSRIFEVDSLVVLHS